MKEKERLIKITDNVKLHNQTTGLEMDYIRGRHCNVLNNHWWKVEREGAAISNYYCICGVEAICSLSFGNIKKEWSIYLPDNGRYTCTLSKDDILCHEIIV